MSGLFTLPELYVKYNRWKSPLHIQEELLQDLLRGTVILSGTRKKGKLEGNICPFSPLWSKNPRFVWKKTMKLSMYNVVEGLRHYFKCLPGNGNLRVCLQKRNMCFKTHEVPKCKAFENNCKRSACKPTYPQPSREAMKESQSSGWDDGRTKAGKASWRQPPTECFLNVRCCVWPHRVSAGFSWVSLWWHLTPNLEGSYCGHSTVAEWRASLYNEDLRVLRGHLP